jgi:3-hydroxybutyryl-CoA dehydrogenase
MSDADAEAAPRAVIVGGGTMGAGVAAAFLGHGWMVDVVEADAQVRQSLPSRLAALLPPDSAATLAARLQVTTTLAQVRWQGVRIVSENVFEELGVKRQVFAELAQLAPPDVPLTSNSSTLLASEISAGSGRADSIMNLHFLMPAHVVPLVEVLATPEIATDVVDRVWRIMLAIGKKPVRLTQALPGFLVNRMQAALMREALALIDAGVATAQDVDTAVRHGFGFRYAACGPILQKEHSGWDISYKLYQRVFPTLANHAAPPDVLERMIAQDRLGMKTGQGFVQWTVPATTRERARFNRAMNEATEVVRGRPDDTEPDWPT